MPLPSRRRAVLALAALSAFAAACALPHGRLAAQAPPATTLARPSGFTLVPHVGMTRYGDIARITVRDDRSDPSYSLDGTLRARFDAQTTFGVSAAFRPLASRWGLFGDFSRSSGEATLPGHVCFTDPDFGSDCASGTTGAAGSQWRLSAGITRSFTIATVSTATLSLGGVYGRTRFALDESEVESMVEGEEKNPGVLIGGAVELPLVPRVGLRVHLTDALVRVSGDAIRQALEEDAAGGGVLFESDPRFVNALGFGLGLVLRL